MCCVRSFGQFFFSIVQKVRVRCKSKSYSYFCTRTTSYKSTTVWTHLYFVSTVFPAQSLIGPEHTGHRWPRFCGGDIYSRRKPLFSSFGEHTAVCGSSVRQAVARPRHRQSVCIHNIHVALVCSGPSVLGSATKTRPPVAKQSGQCARVRHKNAATCG